MSNPLEIVEPGTGGGRSAGSKTVGSVVKVVWSVLKPIVLWVGFIVLAYGLIWGFISSAATELYGIR